MKRNQIFIGVALSALLNLTACGGGDDDPATSGSTFNPDLPGNENTGEPGGDTSAIAGLWDGTVTSDTSDVVYWNLAANGVLTRYDYQQDGAASATGQNCYIAGEPITVTPEGGVDYSIFDVAVTAERNAGALTIVFNEADKNDLDSDGDVTEMPTFNWILLDVPVLEDLNSCTTATEANSEIVADDAVATNDSETNGSTAPILVADIADENSPFPVGIGWTDIPQYSGEGKQYITRAECTDNGGNVVGDIGDGTVFQPGYRCESGAAPVAYITYLNGEPIAAEGEVCCV